MKKLILAIALLAVIALIYGCGEKTQTGEEYEAEITTEEGHAEIKGTAGADEWCAAGTDWESQWAVPGETGMSTLKIEGIVTSGEYKGLCHATWTQTTEEGTAKVDAYFSEDGETAHYKIVNPDGSTFSFDLGQE